MSSARLIVQRVLILAGLVGAGLLVFSWLQSSRAKPQARPPKERGRAVRVIELAAIDAVPRTIGYGVVEAKREWQAIAEVSGEVVELADGVEVGRVVQEGALLFRLEPRTYELEESRTEATVKAVRAQIDELKAREQAARESLKVEERVLELARGDLERTRILYDGGNAPRLDLDNAERAVLTAEKSVQAIKSTLLELPASRKVLGAQLEQMQVGVKGAQLSLAKTEVVAPFTMRIRELNISLHQAVSSGTIVLVGDGIDAVEIPAQMPVGTIGPLLGRRRGASEGRPAEVPAAAPAAEAAEATTGEIAPAPEDAAEGAGEAAEASEAAAAPSAAAQPGAGAGSAADRIQAIVRLESQGVASLWKGRYRRILGVDPTTRTVGVMVEVDEPRRRDQGPPLVPGLHVEVELRGEPSPGCLAIPRAALHGDRVWVVGEDERLRIREASTTMVQEDFVCLAKGVEIGEEVVLTDLTPAVEGMLLAPRPDKEAAARLRAIAAGEEAAR